MRLILGTLCLMLLACDRKVPAPPAPPAAAEAPLPDPSRIPDVAGWFDMGPSRPSFAGPHRGSYQRVRLNAVAAKALAEEHLYPWPDGAQQVKEALDGNGKRIAWFWMSKEKGQWVWAQAGADGKVDERLPGTENACAACHMSRAEKFDGAFSPVFAGKGTLDIPIGK